MRKEHQYTLEIQWTGNTGEGTLNYKSYERNHIIRTSNKPDIPASSDPAFRGDRTRYNPEELLVASLSSCHMLWYLHLCSEAGIVVTDYIDQASGTMVETADGGGRFREVVLNPVITITDELQKEEAHALHQKANERCFIANSVNFPVIHKGVIQVATR